MDLNFSKEDLDFQSEVREFLDKEYPKHIKEKMDNGDDLTRDEIVEWQRNCWLKLRNLLKMS